MNKLYIGDNLVILKSLKDNSIDCVYTDPPYLTWNTKLTYKDNKKEDEWILFMTERLIECHRVMKKEATILIHIDENMITELSTIMNKIFGKKNKITTFCWKKRSSGSAQSKFCTQEHEYILAYAKDIKKAKWNGIPQFEAKERLHNFDDTKTLIRNVPNQTYPLYHGDDPNDKEEQFTLTKGKNSFDSNMKTQSYPIYYNKIDGYGEYTESFFQPSATGAKNTRPFEKHVFPIHTSKTKISLTPFPGSIEIKPMNGKELGCWRCIPKTCQKLIDADMLIVKNNKIYQKQYANFAWDRKLGKLVPTIRTTPIRTILQGDKYPTNLKSNKEIKEIFGKSSFTYSKPKRLVKSLLEVVSNKGDTILDIFAGSGTTASAAFELGRNFILVQIEENGIPELTKIRLNKEVGIDNYEVIDESKKIIE